MSSGGKGGGSQPAAPDYMGLANRQGQINADAARLGTQLSRVNQITPYGSVKYRQVGGSTPASTMPAPQISPASQIDWSSMSGLGFPGLMASAIRQGSPSTPTSTAPTQSDQWEQVTTLSPEQQQIFDLNQQNQIGLNKATGTSLDRVANMGEFDGSDFDRQRIEDSLYGSATRYLDPQFQQRENATRTQLLNSGVREGSEGYQTAMDQLGRDRTLAYGEARDRAISAGGAESTRALTDALRERQQPLNEFLQLYSGGTANVPNSPIGQSQSVQPYDLMGAANQSYQSQLDAYNARQAQSGGLLGGLLGLGGSLGSAAILASDENLKEGIEQIGELPTGEGVYEYAYKDQPDAKRIGVIAQEVEKTQPDAVLTGPDGYKRVDYGKVLARALRAA